MKHISNIIFVYIFLIMAVTVYGETQEDIINNIQIKYKGINDFYATFRQDATIKALDKVQTANGELWIKKDAKMRWNYINPGQDQIISDGTNLWYYYKDEDYVVKANLKEMGSNPNLISLLSDLNNLKKVFKIKVSSTQEENKPYYLIDLTPLDSENDDINKISLAIEKDSLIIHKLFLYDPFNNLTIVKLNNIKINKGIKDKVFEFKVPKGVEVVTPPPVNTNQSS